jgi:hypothetical protein
MKSEGLTASSTIVAIKWTSPPNKYRKSKLFFHGLDIEFVVPQISQFGKGEARQGLFVDAVGGLIGSDTGAVSIDQIGDFGSLRPPEEAFQWPLGIAFDDIVDKGALSEQVLSEIPGGEAAADDLDPIGSGFDVFTDPQETLRSFLPVKDQTDMGRTTFFQITVEDSRPLSGLVESQIDYPNRYLLLLQVITEPEGSHGDMGKIGTGAVYDKKPGFHADFMCLICLLVFIKLALKDKSQRCRPDDIPLCSQFTKERDEVI